YRGNTFWHSFTEIKRQRHAAKMWAFDSFEGLPAPHDDRDDHPVWQQGTMVTTPLEFVELCSQRGIPRQRYETVKGFYDETLPPLKEPQNIALAYIDCDMYSSAVSVLEFLRPRLKQGMIVAFDDYFCMSPN